MSLPASFDPPIVIISRFGGVHELNGFTEDNYPIVDGGFESGIISIDDYKVVSATDHKGQIYHTARSLGLNEDKCIEIAAQVQNLALKVDAPKWGIGTIFEYGKAYLTVIGHDEDGRYVVNLKPEKGSTIKNFGVFDDDEIAQYELTGELPAMTSQPVFEDIKPGMGVKTRTGRVGIVKAISGDVVRVKTNVALSDHKREDLEPYPIPTTPAAGHIIQFEYTERLIIDVIKDKKDAELILWGSGERPMLSDILGEDGEYFDIFRREASSGEMLEKLKTGSMADHDRAIAIQLQTKSYADLQERYDNLLTENDRLDQEVANLRDEMEDAGISEDAAKKLAAHEDTIERLTNNLTLLTVENGRLKREAQDVAEAVQAAQDQMRKQADTNLRSYQDSEKRLRQRVQEYQNQITELTSGDTDQYVIGLKVTAYDLAKKEQAGYEIEHLEFNDAGDLRVVWRKNETDDPAGDDDNATVAVPKQTYFEAPETPIIQQVRDLDPEKLPQNALLADYFQAVPPHEIDTIVIDADGRFDPFINVDGVDCGQFSPMPGNLSSLARAVENDGAAMTIAAVRAMAYGG